MKTFSLTFILTLTFTGFIQAQTSEKEHEIRFLIDQYSKARGAKDPELLKAILVKDIDQLVSSGEWRRGSDTALEGMMRSFNRRPGFRTLTPEKVRFLNKDAAIVDARYVVTNSDGSLRKMWSTFIVVHEDDRWKISAIRNMLPAS